MTIPVPANASKIELLLMNAGEGAFRWVRCHGNGSGGFIVDCGTRSGKRQLERSVNEVAATLSSQPELLVVSHYHSDHHSKMSFLSDKLGQIEPKEVWIPKIDPYSLNLYLRMISVGTLFENWGTTVGDSVLAELFSKRNDIEHDFGSWFPNATVKRVGAGDENTNVPGVSVKALSPAPMPRNREHPLRAPNEEAGRAMESRRLREAVEQLCNQLVTTASRMERFEEFLGEHFDARDRDLLQGFGARFTELFGARLAPGRLDRENTILRLMLAVSTHVPRSTVQRLPVYGDGSDIDRGRRGVFRRVGKNTRNATHLFNIAVRFAEDEGPSYLLTGDADPRLWDLIFREGHDYTAVQTPHHGSEENVLDSAYQALNCNTFLVSANKYSSWRHPSNHLGTTIASTGQGRSFYCTNKHDNCELQSTPPRCNPPSITAISVTGNSVDWIVGGSRVPAVRCPEV